MKTKVNSLVVALLLGGGGLIAEGQTSRPAAPRRVMNTQLRLSEPDRRLVEDLARRGMPELVEALLADRSPFLRSHIARAYARAAESEDEPHRSLFLDRAEATYESLLESEKKPDWVNGETSRLAVAEWQVEWADLLLRQRAGPELDRFEITSGLDFDGARTTRLLDQALRLYSRAKEGLDDLVVGLRDNEENFLLMGLADAVPRLAGRRAINQAWAQLYRAQVSEAEAPERAAMATGALSAFDGISRQEKSAEQKYAAVLGAAIALREMGRLEESLAAFDRVLASTASPEALARARYEKARCLMGAKRFDAARAELAALRSQPTAENEGRGIRFYVRLAPLLAAYSDALDAEPRPPDDPRKRELQSRADEFFEQLGREPGWQEVAAIYQEHLAEGGTDPATMSEARLRSRSQRLMRQGRYADAASLLRVLMERAQPDEQKAETLLNLGVCQFQNQAMRQAAEAFAKAAALTASGDSALKAAEYAYRSYRQLARDTRAPDDYAELARSAQRLVERAPEHGLAAEAAWTGAIAFEEAGDFRAAQRLYSRVPREGENYRAARRATARCLQAVFEKTGEAAPPEQRKQAAREAVTAWLQFVWDFEPAKPQGTTTQPTSAPSDREVNDARLAAASILTGSDLREFDEALSVISELADDDGVLVLRVRANCGLGRIEQAKQQLNQLLARPDRDIVGSVLGGFVKQVQREIARLTNLGQRDEARKLAEQSAPLLQALVNWAEQKADRRSYAKPVRAAFARVLKESGRLDDAAAEWDRLIEAEPSSGEYLREAAIVQEALAAASESAARKKSADKAETLWARLLTDPGLRESFPSQYWEARYQWLSHQLRRGRSRAVLAAIDSERAWYPDLGGPPWQARLLDLAERARTQLEAGLP